MSGGGVDGLMAIVPEVMVIMRKKAMSSGCVEIFFFKDCMEWVAG